MVAYSFKRQFVDPILSGSKRQTIRADRRRHARPGEQLQLYTGMRTKHCKLIARAMCEAIEPLMLDFSGHGVVKVGETVLFSDARMQEFARRDGFATWAEMRAFWHENHPGEEIFVGVMIRWGALQS